MVASAVYERARARSCTMLLAPARDVVAYDGAEPFAVPPHWPLDVDEAPPTIDDVIDASALLGALDSLLGAHLPEDVERHWSTARYTLTRASSERARGVRVAASVVAVEDAITLTLARAAGSAHRHESRRFRDALRARPRLAEYTAAWPAAIDVVGVLATHARTRRLPHVLALVTRAYTSGVAHVSLPPTPALVERLVCEAAARGDTAALTLALVALAPGRDAATAGLHVHAALGHAPDVGVGCARGDACYDCSRSPAYARAYARAAAAPDAVRDSTACVVALLAAGADVHALGDAAGHRSAANEPMAALLAAATHVRAAAEATKPRTRGSARGGAR